jgi:hypothetical protein
VDDAHDGTYARQPQIEDLARIGRSLNAAGAHEIVVDLMGAACGISYAEGVADAETLRIEGVPIPVASLKTLIRTKNTPRPLDAADRAYLQALLDSEK